MSCGPSAKKSITMYIGTKYPIPRLRSGEDEVSRRRTVTHMAARTTSSLLALHFPPLFFFFSFSFSLALLSFFFFLLFHFACNTKSSSNAVVIKKDEKSLVNRATGPCGPQKEPQVCA